MRTVLLFWLIVCCAQLSLAQNQPGAKYTKIRFVYSSHTNYVVRENGVYGDTLALRKDFPELSISPGNDAMLPESFGFIPLANFQGENRRQLIGILYHANETTEGVYDLAKEKTEFKVVRDDPQMRAIFKILKESYSRFTCSGAFNYRKNKVSLSYAPNDMSFSEFAKALDFTNAEKTTAHYLQRTHKGLEDTKVTLDPALDPKVTPLILYGNATFGIKKITTLSATTELVSVTYE